MADRPGTQGPLTAVKRERHGWRTWTAGLVALLTIVFVVQNSQEVEVDFIFATSTMPLVFALLIAIGLGALIGWLLPRVRGK